MVWALLLLAVAVLAALGAVFGLVMFFSGAKRTNQALRKVPVTKVAGTQDGKMARVAGKLKPVAGPMLMAPLSGKRCGYFQSVAEELRPSGKSEGWVQLAYEEQWCDFCLDDGTGLILVRMLRPQVSADLEQASYSDHMVPPSPAQETFLRRHQVGGPGESSAAKQLRYLESLFELDEEITAYGVVRHESGSDGPRVVIEAPEGQMLLVSDDKHTARPITVRIGPGANPNASMR
ncbi:MAG: hypothetical protein H0T76_19085 [Nannocystis sp.]|nr:hypothetical protein [Nannocystis sp.]MBA3548594.1 hypothetical protein [Nannocystis sp.]